MKKGRLKKILFKVGYNLVVVFILSEIILRFLPSRYTEFTDRISYNSDDVIGYLPTPLQDQNYTTNCVKNSHIKTNEMGMRITPTIQNQQMKISLLGDSFLHGLTVPDSFHLATKLSRFTQSEVLNGGVSGYGTYQELLLWRKLMKPKKPAITILFFFLENDIKDNQCALAKADGQVYSPCCEVKNGTIKPVNNFEKRTNTNEGFINWFKKNCFTYRAVKNLLKSNNNNTTGEDFFKEPSFAYNVYRPNFDKKWEDGWEITEWCLASLKKECDEIGSKLLIVNVPGPVQWSYNWKKEISKQIQDDYLPKDLNLQYAQNRYQRILNKNNIESLDLTPYFINYRNHYKLSEPVFGWCCDSHWNPIGHHLVAEKVTNHLIELGWSNGKILQPTKSPKAIVGNDLFEKIYSCEEISF
jgi:hypothetical protein